MGSQDEKTQILDELLALNSFYETEKKIAISIDEVNQKSKAGLNVDRSKWDAYCVQTESEIRDSLVVTEQNGDVSLPDAHVIDLDKRNIDALCEKKRSLEGSISSEKSELVFSALSLTAITSCLLVPISASCGWWGAFVVFLVTVIISVVGLITKMVEKKKMENEETKIQIKIDTLSKEVWSLNEAEQNHKEKIEELFLADPRYKVLTDKKALIEEEVDKKKSQYSKELNEQLSALRILDEDNSEKLSEFLKNSLIVPVFYAKNEDAVRKMLFLMMNKRANDITSLVNLYEDTEWKGALLETVSEIKDSIDSAMALEMKELQEVSDAKNEMIYTFVCGVSAINQQIDNVVASIPQSYFGVSVPI